MKPCFLARLTAWCDKNQLAWASPILNKRMCLNLSIKVAFWWVCVRTFGFEVYAVLPGFKCTTNPSFVYFRVNKVRGVVYFCECVDVVTLELELPKLVQHIWLFAGKTLNTHFMAGFISRGGRWTFCKAVSALDCHQSPEQQLRSHAFANTV